MTEQKPEHKITLDLTGGEYGFVFPEGTDQKSKDAFFFEVMRAKINRLPIEISPQIKIVPLKVEAVPTPQPVQVPVPVPAQAPVPATPIVTPLQQPQPTITSTTTPPATTVTGS